MAYYVLGNGGAKYGPVDIDRLNAWIDAHRVGPETLIEESGSGVKVPARAIPGLKFTSLPDSGMAITHAAPPPPPTPPVSPALQSTYMRPQSGSGGSSHNLFLPGSDPMWAWQSLACAGAALAAAAAIHFLHLYLGRITILAFLVPFAGIQRAFSGFNRNRSLASAMVAMNVLAFIAAVGLAVSGFLGWVR